MARGDKLYDSAPFKKAREESKKAEEIETGGHSEPVDPEDLADDAGDMSLNPNDAGEKLRRAGAEKRKEQKKKAKPD